MLSIHKYVWKYGLDFEKQAYFIILSARSDRHLNDLRLDKYMEYISIETILFPKQWLLEPIQC